MPVQKKSGNLLNAPRSLAPRQRNFNIDPTGLSQYYYYTSIVKAKCKKTFAKLDLQISAELPNPKLLFFAKNLMFY